jgi:hypothetical protein
MEGTPAEGWEDELERWFEPFLAGLRGGFQNPGGLVGPLAPD